MIGQAIKAIREERGITQYELAKRLGYSQSNISKYENGDLGIDATFLIKIARAMDCSIVNAELKMQENAEEIM